MNSYCSIQKGKKFVEFPLRNIIIQNNNNFILQLLNINENHWPHASTTILGSLSNDYGFIYFSCEWLCA
jgi:hypothetical protein